MTSVEAFVSMALTDPKRLYEDIDAMESVSLEFANDVALSGYAALDAGDLWRARAAFTFAGTLYLKIQDLPRVVYTGIKRTEIDKVLAETEEEHETARLSALAMAGAARRMRLADLMFAARVVAADSAYFAAQACDQARNQEGYRKWLLVAAQDCVEALELMEASSSENQSLALISLVTATVQEASTTILFADAQPAMDRALRAIALAVEAFVPPGTESSNIEGRQDDSARILARLSYERGSPDIGRARLTSVVERAERKGDLDTFMVAMSALYKGERSAYRLSDDLTEVRNRFVDAIDEYRRRPRSLAARLWAAQRLDDLSGELVSDEFSRLVGRDVGRSHRAIEIMKARTLLDEMAGLRRIPPDPAVRSRLASLEARVLNLAAPPSLDDAVGDVVRLVSRLPIGTLGQSAHQPDGLTELEDLYARHDAGFVDSAPVADLDEVIDALGPREAVLSYHIPYDARDPAATLLILMISKQGALPIHLPLLFSEDQQQFIGRVQVDGQQPVDSSPFGELILNTRIAIQEGRDETAARCLAQLHRILITPLVEVGFEISEHDTLYIAPHGILHAVPFAALRTPEGRFLAEDVATVVVPSASVWAALRRRPATRPASFLGFANPVLEDFDPLPESETEVDAIAAGLTGLDIVVHKGGNASETALWRDLPGRGIVHLATHGEFPQANVMNMHRVLLTPGGGHDGHVNAEELRVMDLSAAELVVLSICNGGVYRFGPGDEPYGLLSAMLAAGARNIVGPAWAIDDTQARLLITEFYQWLMTRGPAEALRHAAVSRMRAGAEIRDWAGFVLFGAGTWQVDTI